MYKQPYNYQLGSPRRVLHTFQESGRRQRWRPGQLLLPNLMVSRNSPQVKVMVELYGLRLLAITPV